MYFTMQPSLHVVITFLFSTPSWTRPKYDIGLFVPLSLASTEFSNILWKGRNTTETGKFCSSAQNFTLHRKLWSQLRDPKFYYSEIMSTMWILYLVISEMKEDSWSVSRSQCQLHRAACSRSMKNALNIPTGSGRLLLLHVNNIPLRLGLIIFITFSNFFYLT